VAGQGADVAEQVGTRDQLGAAVDAELSEQVLDVRRHRLLADNELSCDLLLPSTFDEEVEHLEFTAGEVRDPPISCRHVAGKRPPIHKTADSGDELVGIERFYDEVVGAE